MKSSRRRTVHVVGVGSDESCCMQSGGMILMQREESDGKKGWIDRKHGGRVKKRPRVILASEMAMNASRSGSSTGWRVQQLRGRQAGLYSTSTESALICARLLRSCPWP